MKKKTPYFFITLEDLASSWVEINETLKHEETLKLIESEGEKGVLLPEKYRDIVNKNKKN